MVIGFSWEAVSGGLGCPEPDLPALGLLFEVGVSLTYTYI
jgi:hypothetical protein